MRRLAPSRQVLAEGRAGGASNRNMQRLRVGRRGALNEKDQDLMTITAGNFVLSNFISDGDGTLSFAPTLIFPLFSSTGDFVFNWNGVDAEGNNAGTAPVTVSDGGTENRSSVDTPKR